jgi:hypothetical protein
MSNQPSWVSIPKFDKNEVEDYKIESNETADFKDNITND